MNLLFFALSLTPPRRPFSAGPILLQSSRRERMDQWTLLSFAPPASLRQLRDQRRSPSDSSPPPVSARPRRASAGRGLSFSVSTFPCFCFILLSASRNSSSRRLTLRLLFFADPAAVGASLPCIQICLSSLKLARAASRPSHSLTATLFKRISTIVRPHARACAGRLN